MKKWVIELKEQNFQFYNYSDAKAKVLEMISNGCWFMNLKEIDTENKEKPKDCAKKNKTQRGKNVN